MQCLFFFFKQKTAYEMRISDWSSDVCSSDLPLPKKSLRRSHFRSQSPNHGQSLPRRADTTSPYKDRLTPCSSTKLSIAYSSNHAMIVITYRLHRSSFIVTCGLPSKRDERQ